MTTQIKGNATSTFGGNVDVTGNVVTDAPAFSARAGINQTLTAATWTKLVFDIKEFDTNSNYDNTTNYRFTPTVAGYYQVNLGFKIESVTNRGILALYKNGGLYKLGDDVQGTYVRNLTGSFLVYCNGSTDYIEAYGYDDGGGATNVNNTISHQTHFQAFLARAV